jgi:hypothetical protein
MLKADAAFGPFLELGSDIFGDKNNLRGPADELVLLRVGLGDDKRKDRGAIGRGDGNPTVTGLKPGIKGQMESKLIQVEAQAAILVTNENVNAVKAQVQVLPSR